MWWWFRGQDWNIWFPATVFGISLLVHKIICRGTGSINLIKFGCRRTLLPSLHQSKLSECIEKWSYSTPWHATSGIESPDPLWPFYFSDDSCVFVCLCEKAAMAVRVHTSLLIIYLLSLRLREYRERGGSQKEVHALRENRTRVSPWNKSSRLLKWSNFKSSHSHQEGDGAAVTTSVRQRQREGQVEGLGEKLSREEMRTVSWNGLGLD